MLWKGQVFTSSVSCFLVCLFLCTCYPHDRRPKCLPPNTTNKKNPWSTPLVLYRFVLATPNPSQNHGPPPNKLYRGPTPNPSLRRLYESQTAQNSRVPGGLGCFGCGVPGHRLRDCNVMKQCKQNQEIKKDPRTWKFTLMDGSSIFCEGNESIAQAVSCPE